jgi:hypothetical protein
MSKASSLEWSLVVTFLALSGCGGSSSDNGTGGTGGSGGSGGSGGTGMNLPDPCTLVTFAELEPIAGIGLVRTERIGGLTGDPGCMWYDADDFAVFQVALWNEFVQYDASAMDDDSSPIVGVGEEAHLGTNYTVHVKLPTSAFFAQSLYPVADGQISAEVRASAKGTMMNELEEYEASYRLAKLVEPRL